ncbi:MAG: butyrate kinase [Phycisphaerae bacterium]|nr:butyrate kinase [Phycisphaerae bacterium]
MLKSPLIFIINPGSTTTKLALYQGQAEIFQSQITHRRGQLEKFTDIESQSQYRTKCTLGELKKQKINLADIDIFMGRGGLIKPVSGGTFIINETMLEELRTQKYGKHASNMGAIIADKLAQKHNKPAYIANPVVVDELSDIARITGHKEMPRRSVFHALSHKAAGQYMADKLKTDYKKLNMIIAHCGGGISIAAHQKGRIVDVNNALEGDGPFTPERTGSLCLMQFNRYVRDNNFSYTEAYKLVSRNGGLINHLGTNDCRKIEDKALNGDADFKLVYDAFIYQIGKAIGSLAPALNGKVDAIVLTGGIANSKYFVKKVKSMTKFIAQIHIITDNLEMSGLARCGLDIYQGKAKPQVYK